MEIVKRHPKMILFGILQVFFTAPGQTFLISLFVGPIFNDLGTSLTVFAGVYSLATLLGALLLNPLGRCVDRFDVRWMMIAITLAMMTGCFLVASAHSLGMLFAGFFILRLLGQGGFVMTAMTTFAKNFERNRGKATGLLMLGYPMSEWIYPGLAVMLMLEVGWRTTYILFGLSFILIMLPIQLYLLNTAGLRPGKFLPHESLSKHDEPDPNQVHMKLGQAMKDPVFFWTILAYCLPPVVLSGLFFHQEILFRLNDWPVAFMATALGTYAFAKAVLSVLIGPVIDKQGPIPTFCAMVFLLGIATLLGGLGGPLWVSFLYYALLGVAIGVSGPITGVLWPNLYGTKHIGSIKGFVSTFRNGLTSLGPMPIALAMDMGISIRGLFIVTAIIVCAMSVIPLGIAKAAPRVHGPRAQQG